MNEFFTEYPPVVKHPHTSSYHHQKQLIDWQEADDSLQIDRTVNEVSWAIPGKICFFLLSLENRILILQEILLFIGYTGGIAQLESFINERIVNFASGRNDPNKDALSNISPWFHYGQISPQRTLLIIAKLRSKFKDACDSFIEEAFVRRELSDNYCFYQENCKIEVQRRQKRTKFYLYLISIFRR